MHNFMVSRSVNYDQIIIIDFKKNIQSMRIPLNFLTKSENPSTNFTSKSLSLKKKKKEDSTEAMKKTPGTEDPKKRNIEGGEGRVWIESGR